MRVVNELLDASAGDHCQNGRCPKAIAAWELVLLKEPRNLALHYQLGRCFSGACRPHSLIDTEIALEHFQAATRLAEHQAPAPVRASILDALGKTYLSSSRFPARARRQTAVHCMQRAADLYLSEGRLEDWAREQSNLGLAKCEMPEEECPDKWSEAVDHFETALWVRRRERDPEGHAATLLNLGTAYRSLEKGNRQANVWKAIECYRRALRFFQPESFPGEYATLHNNLGNACLFLPSEGPGDTEPQHPKRPASFRPGDRLVYEEGASSRIRPHTI
jgi:tetratricopeptide (TPR) repeat protein